MLEKMCLCSGRVVRGWKLCASFLRRDVLLRFQCLSEGVDPALHVRGPALPARVARAASRHADGVG